MTTLWRYLTAPEGRSPSERAVRGRTGLTVGGLFLVFLAVRWWFRLRGVWEWDEVLFSEGVLSYDISVHHPHPPGYPFYILLGKLVNLMIGSPDQSLIYLSVLTGALSVIPFYFLIRSLTDRSTAIATVVLFSVCPAVWLTGERGLSDTPSLFFLLWGLALWFSGKQRTLRLNLAVVVLFSLAVGTRPQVILIVAPLLVVIWFTVSRQGQRVSMVLIPILFCLMMGIWGAIVVRHCGGWDTCQFLLTSQGTQLVSVDSIWGSGISAIADRWKRFLIDSWGDSHLGYGLNGVTLIGLITIWYRKKRDLQLLFVIFLPAFAFTLFFCEPHEHRYMIPFLPFISVSAVLGMFRITEKLPRAKPVSYLFIGLCSLSCVIWSIQAFRDFPRKLPAALVAAEYVRGESEQESEQQEVVIAGFAYHPVLSFFFRNTPWAVFREEDTGSLRERRSARGDAFLIREIQRDIGGTSERHFSFGNDRLKTLSRDRFLETEVIRNPVLLRDGWTFYYDDQKIGESGRLMFSQATCLLCGRGRFNTFQIEGHVRGTWKESPILVIETENGRKDSYKLDDHRFSIRLTYRGKELPPRRCSLLTLSIIKTDDRDEINQTPLFVTKLRWQCSSEKNGIKPGKISPHTLMITSGKE